MAGSAAKRRRRVGDMAAHAQERERLPVVRVEIFLAITRGDRIPLEDERYRRCTGRIR